MVGKFEGENQDNAAEKGHAENGDEGWDLGDPDLLRNADTPNAADLADPSSKLHQWFDQSIEKPFGVDNEGGHELEDGVMSYGSIMGLCENEFGVIAADSRVTYRHGNAIHTEDTVVKVVKVAPHVGMVGSGSQRIISEVEKSIKAFDFDNVVDCIVDMTTSCVEKTKNLYPDVTVIGFLVL